MPAKWTTYLCNASGGELADLTFAANKKIEYQLNAPNIASMVLPLTSDAAALVEPGSTYIKMYRKPESGPRVLRFFGPVWSDQIEANNGGVDSLQITAFDPSIYLTKR